MATTAAAAAKDHDAEVSSNNGVSIATSVISARSTTSAANGGGGEGEENEMIMSIPQTPLELDAFLATIDGPCPLNKSNETNDEASSLQVAATYQATAVNIPASEQRQVRIPIFCKHSTVSWHIVVFEYDVMFSISKETSTTTTSQDDEEVDGAVVLVEPQTVTAVSRQEQVEALDTSTSSHVSTSSAAASTTTTMPAAVALSGEFLIEDVPTTVVLQFGNEYSWFTPKTISYSVTVTPPPDPAKLARAERAAAALQLVMQQTTAAHAQLEARKRRVHEQTTQLQHVVQQQVEKKASVANQQTVIQASHDQTREMDLLHQKVAESLDTKRAQIIKRDQEMEHLQRQIAELQRLLQARVQEKEELQRDVAAGETSAQKLQQRRELMRHEIQQDEEHLRQIQDECRAVQMQVDAAKTARDEAVQEQHEAAQVLNFLQHQVAAALRMRL
jgi:myosin heavy subunit